MFWSSQTLLKNLKTVIPEGKEDRVETASYCLTIGPEVFITPNYESHELKDHTKRILEKDQNFNIPCGQFAFLLTEEEIYVPEDAIAFISFKAKKKFKGLVNVSGFHVDPGYKGRLVFALFNAGPKTITLKRGEKFFLIWFANLDEKTNDVKDKEIRREIDTEIINGINGEVYNPMVIRDKIKDLDAKIGDIEGKKIPEIETKLNNKILYALIGAIVLFLVTFSGKIYWDFHKDTSFEKIEEKILAGVRNEIKMELIKIPEKVGQGIMSGVEKEIKEELDKVPEKVNVLINEEFKNHNNKPDSHSQSVPKLID